MPTIPPDPEYAQEEPILVDLGDIPCPVPTPIQERPLGRFRVIPIPLHDRRSPQTKLARLTPPRFPAKLDRDRVPIDIHEHGFRPRDELTGGPDLDQGMFYLGASTRRRRLGKTVSLGDHQPRVPLALFPTLSESRQGFPRETFSEGRRSAHQGSKRGEIIIVDDRQVGQDDEDGGDDQRPRDLVFLHRLEEQDGFELG